MIPLMAAMGVMAIMSTKAGQKNEQRNIAAQVKAHGIEQGGIDFSAQRAAEMTINRVHVLRAEKVQADMIIDKAHAQAESDAIVSAGTAGVSGQSVDATINETTRTAAEAKGSINRRVQAEKLQITTDYTDNYLNADMKKGEVEFRQRSSGSKNLEMGLAFAQGFISGL